MQTESRSKVFTPTSTESMSHRRHSPRMRARDTELQELHHVGSEAGNEGKQSSPPVLPEAHERPPGKIQPAGSHRRLGFKPASQHPKAVFGGRAQAAKRQVPKRPAEVSEPREDERELAAVQHLHPLAKKLQRRTVTSRAKENPLGGASVDAGNHHRLKLSSKCAAGNAPAARW